MTHHSFSTQLKLTTILFGLTISLCSCSSSYSVSSTGKPDSEYSYKEMNNELDGRNVNIVLKDGGEVSAKEVAISGDSVVWVGRRTKEQSKASVHSINKIVVKSPSIGALEGLGFGLVGGGGLGALLGSFSSGGRMGTSFATVVSLIVGAGAGTVIGSITGAGIGQSYNYEFQTIAQSDSLQNGK